MASTVVRRIYPLSISIHSITSMIACFSEFRWPLPPPPPPPPPPAVCCSLPSAAYYVYTAAAHKIRRRTILSKQSQASSQSVAAQKPEEEEEEEEENFQVLRALQSNHNHIVILDTPKSRLLLLDSTHNVHSMLNKESKWTGSYWDEFAALPPVVPRGRIAIFGLGGGTAARLMLSLWPSLLLEGWEIDSILIDQSREYFGLYDLEKHTVDGGLLNVHIGDVFSPEAAISGGYAGIIVDLFAEGKVLPQLEQVHTWLELSDKLMPDGRFMVNCGAGGDGLPATDTDSQHEGPSTDGSWKLNATIRALSEAFPGQVNWKKMPQRAGENYLALTGSLPDMTSWSAALPDELKSSVDQWRICNIHDN